MPTNKCRGNCRNTKWQFCNHQHIDSDKNRQWRGQWWSKQLQALIFPQKLWKIRRNSQNQLCQNSEKQPKVDSNQVNAESRKRQCENSSKALWHSQVPFPAPPGAGIAAHISNMGPWTQVPEGADLICKLLGIFVLTLSGAAWRADGRHISLRLTQNSGWKGKGVAGEKSTVQTDSNHLGGRLGGESLKH